MTSFYQPSYQPTKYEDIGGYELRDAELTDEHEGKFTIVVRTEKGVTGDRLYVTYIAGDGTIIRQGYAKLHGTSVLAYEQAMSFASKTMYINDLKRKRKTK